MARIVPEEPGWTDETLQSPLVDAGRARREPRVASLDALSETLQGLRHGAGDATPQLDPAPSGPGRVKEFESSAGTRGPLDP